MRTDSQRCSPAAIDWCYANAIDFILGVTPTTTLREHGKRRRARSADPTGFSTAPAVGAASSASSPASKLAAQLLIRATRPDRSRRRDL
ncbi:hypothetical protein [Aquibium pacificus]|uniref:hypothetical protein n=1 Tax=Aquibium pacificus TaxID=3153579 RepID=UPI00349F1DDE